MLLILRDKIESIVNIATSDKIVGLGPEKSTVDTLRLVCLASFFRSQSSVYEGTDLIADPGHTAKSSLFGIPSNGFVDMPLKAFFIIQFVNYLLTIELENRITHSLSRYLRPPVTNLPLNSAAW